MANDVANYLHEKNTNPPPTKRERLMRGDTSEKSSVEKDLRIAARNHAVGNDRELYALLFGAPGEYPAMD